MSKNLQNSVLLDLYGCLLTDKQNEIMDLYYNDDLSLGEIAAQLDISRQGVHDAIKKCETAMADYEEKLGLLKQQEAYLAELKEFKAQAMDVFNECKKKNYARDIAEKVIVLLENLDSKLDEFDNAEYTEEEYIYIKKLYGGQLMAFEGLSEKLNGVFKRLKSRGKLSEADVKEAMREVKMALLEADVSYKVVKDFIAKVTERSVGEEVLKSLTPGQQVIKIVNDELIKLMGEANSKINFPNKPPCIIMMCGLQGSGKTTHAAKLAKMFKKEGKRPLLIAADVYRPAAIEQLKVVGERAEVAVFEMGQIDPRKIVKEGIKHAKDYGNDLVIIDTAGRLHIDEELMNELKDIKKIAEPNEIMLVVDAMIGQDAVKVASSFDEALGIDSVILTKLDSDTRGGAALSVLAVTGKPIKFVGMGEKLDEFEAFHPERMASRILGMGDMLTLIEKATQTVDEKDAKKLAEKMQEKGFDLNDLLEQMKQIQKMGSMKSIIRMLPGANKVTDEQVEQGEVQLKKTEAMINSMTRAEREKPAIIDPKRKRRIAAGSGTQVSDVNQLLKQFEQMQKMMKQFGIGGNLHGKKSRRNRAALLKGLGGGMPQ